MKRLFRKNHWSTEDKLIAAAGVVTAVGILFIVKQRKDAAAVATSGLRGLGAYFVDPMNLPISGLGNNYVQVR